MSYILAYELYKPWLVLADFFTNPVSMVTPVISFCWVWYGHMSMFFSEIVMGIHVGNQNPRCYYNLQNRYLQIQDIWTRFQLMGHVRHIWVRSYESWKLREFLWPTKEGVFFAVRCFLQVVWEKIHKGPHAVACFSGSLVWKCSQFSLDLNSTLICSSVREFTGWIHWLVVWNNFYFSIYWE